jgi:hypothetical protein
VLVGLADVGWMIYCFIHRMPYSSSLNLFAVAVGVFLIRGSLRTATYVRWFSIFFLSGCGAALLVWPAIQPIDLTLTEIRLNKGPATTSVVMCLLVAVLSYWISAELGDKPVQKAIEAVGLKQYNVRWAAAAAVSLVICGTLAWNFLVDGETAQRMISMAEQGVGPGYQLTVRSLRISQHYGEKSVTGVVIAWKDGQVREIPVHWEERRALTGEGLLNAPAYSPCLQAGGNSDCSAVTIGA